MMVEKILNLKSIEGLTNREFTQLENVLKKINFFSEQSEKVHPKDKHIKREYKILNKYPNEKDRINGQNYILEEWINEKEKIVYAKTYNFNGKIISECS